MSPPKIMWSRLTFIGQLFLLAIFLPAVPAAAAEMPHPYELLHHDLHIELDPVTHEIIGQDTVKIRSLKSHPGVISFHLHKDLKIQKVFLKGQPQNFIYLNAPSTKERKHIEGYRVLKIFLPEEQKAGETIDLIISYRGQIYDPPSASASLRSVAPDQTSGLIGEEGIYLPGEAFWYPELPQALPTFYLVVKTPPGWEVVSQGGLASRRSDEKGNLTTWQVEQPTEALTLVSGRYVITTQTVDGIALSTYFFQEDAHLSKEYIETSARYIKTYSELLGPYPFPKFSVVENFFPSGFGFPSFTLLGSRIIKRHYVQPYSLGHEIVHCWIGNYVYNDIREGNWVEGLTTYLANYYYEEVNEGHETARQHRHRMLVEYSTYVDEHSDYPINEFEHSINRVDNAIGYQKTAMVFHMLRGRMGDSAFFGALRTLVQDYGGRIAAWDDLQTLFEHASGEDLKSFFRQWVRGKGGPLLSLQGVQIAQADRGYTLHATLIQARPFFDLRVPLVIESSAGRVETLIAINEGREPISMTLEIKPDWVKLDPDYHVFRRLHRVEMSSNLNLLMADPEKIVVYPDQENKKANIYAELAHRIQQRGEATVKSDRQWDSKDLKTHSVLILGGPEENRALNELKGRIPHSLDFSKAFFSVGGRTYKKKDNALLVSFRNPFDSEKVISVFYGLSPESVSGVSRLLFYYGWHSYVIFEGGKAIEKGEFPPPTEPLTIQLK